MSMSALWADFVAGCVLGLSAGMAPGPLMTLVITESVSVGFGAGLRVALAPLITDPPIIALCALVLVRLAHSAEVLGVVSLAGGCFILHMARDAWKARPPVESSAADRRSLVRGVMTNVLNPHPYLFWLSVGAPLLVTGWRRGPAGPVVFLAGFYGCLVGAKVVVAVLAGRSRHLLVGRGYALLLRFMALTLAVFALFFFRDAWLLFSAGSVS